MNAFVYVGGCNVRLPVGGWVATLSRVLWFVLGIPAEMCWRADREICISSPGFIVILRSKLNFMISPLAHPFCVLERLDSFTKMYPSHKFLWTFIHDKLPGLTCLVCIDYWRQIFGISFFPPLIRLISRHSKWKRDHGSRWWRRFVFMTVIRKAIAGNEGRFPVYLYSTRHGVLQLLACVTVVEVFTIHFQT